MFIPVYFYGVVTHLHENIYDVKGLQNQNNEKHKWKHIMADIHTKLFVW